MRKLREGLLYIGFLRVAFSVSSLVLAFTLSWILLANMNFLYPIWHDIGGIGQGIDKFGPQNQFKAGFGDTSPSQRAELFAHINQAIHQHGQGLSEISYETPTSNGPQLMLREPEITHLQDVANLIDVLRVFVVINGIIWCVLGYAIVKMPRRVVFWPSQIGGVVGSIALVSILVLLIGPVKVFNQLHIWIFPKDNQWFFYYQESLMSTLMLAPTVFAWIAGALTIVGILFFASLLTGTVLLEGKAKNTP